MEPRGAETSSTPRAPETRYNREQVLSAFNTASTLIESAEESSLTPEEQYVRRSVQEARKKTIDKGGDTFRNKFERVDRRGMHQQQEGIPIDGLLAFIDKQLLTLPADSPKRQELQDAAHILYTSSQSFSDIPHRLEPSRFIARVRQEAYFLSQDPALQTGTMEGDYFKGIEPFV